MNLSLRLKEVASFCEKGAYILDCGCDHAYLPIYLIKNKIVKKAYASDINEKPLKFAKENIKKYGLEKKINIYQADGLNNLDPKVDTIILSGMGTTTILNILKKGDLKNVKNLIISSNNDYDILRKEIVKHGFYIKNEKVVLDRNKFYEIILFTKGNKNYTKKELKYGPILIQKKDKIFKLYLNKRLDTNKKIYMGLSLKHIIKRIKLKKEIREMESLI